MKKKMSDASAYDAFQRQEAGRLRRAMVAAAWNGDSASLAHAVMNGAEASWMCSWDDLPPDAPERAFLVEPFTALHVACVRNRVSAAKLLLGRGGDPLARDGMGMLPLLSAVRAGAEGTVVGILVSCAARVDAEGGQQYGVPQFPPPHDRPRGGAPLQGEIVAALLENWRDETGATALHIAVVHSSPAMSRLLAERGAKLDSRDRDGSTPLHLAAALGRYDTCLTLLALDAASDTSDDLLDLRNADHASAVELAAKNGHVLVCEVLAMMRSRHITGMPVLRAVVDP